MASDRTRLLVVDDTAMNRDILSRRLTRKGYDVTCAVDGRDALEQVGRQSFALVLLDIMMPGIDGMEVLRILRRTHGPTQLPVIMATAKEQSEDIVQALHDGANDYVTKPIDFPVLLARIETHVGLKRATEALDESYRRIKMDLDAAARIQHALLPTSVPDNPGVRIAWRYEPCDELAGDILNVFELDGEHLGLYLLDVSGHGVQAALLSSAIRHVLSSTSEDGSVVKDRAEGNAPPRMVPPAEVAHRLNRRFPLDQSTAQYFTILYGILDLAEKNFQYVPAGHPGPLVLTADGDAAIHERTGFPIGFVEDPDYGHDLIELHAADRVYLYSDGIVEAANADREAYGRERLIEMARQTRPQSLEESLSVLLQSVQDWTEGQPQDDVSILAFEIA